MAYCGPLYVALGLSLILAVAYAYLALILRQLYAARGPVQAALHLLFGSALLFNILINYWLCVATQPGSTAAMKEVPASRMPTARPHITGMHVAMHGAA